MISLDKVKKGLAIYIEKKMMPKLSGWQRIALGVSTNLITPIDTVSLLEIDSVKNFLNSPFVVMLDVVHDDVVDIDKLYKALLDLFPEGHKEILPMPKIMNIIKFDDYTIDRSDIELLYKYIMESN